MTWKDSVVTQTTAENHEKAQPGEQVVSRPSIPEIQMVSVTAIPICSVPARDEGKQYDRQKRTLRAGGRDRKY
jgi:hypothetical protein